MLSSDYVDLVRRDQGIPGLAVVLDPERFLDILQKVSDIEPASSELTYLRYKPRVSCLAVHRVNARGGTLALTAEAFGEDGAVRMGKAREQAARAGALGSAKFLLTRDRIAIGVFPYDPKLSSVARLRSEAGRGRLLSRVMPNKEELWSGTITTLAYKPERRYVARLEGEHGARAVLKFYSREGFEKVRLAAKALPSPTTLRVPHQLGRSRRHRVLAFPWLSGVSLRELLTQRRNSSQRVEATGAVLAEIHHLRTKALAVRTRRREMEQLLSLATTIGYLLPSCAGPARTLSEKLCVWLGDQSDPRVPIHGDFYDKQVLFDRDRIGLIDFDEFTIGDPRADLGLFLAHLERNVARGMLLERECDSLSDAFVQGYVDAGGAKTAEELSPYIAIGLMQLLHDPFRRGEKEWAERTRQLLERAEMHCATSLPAGRSR